MQQLTKEEKQEIKKGNGTYIGRMSVYKGEIEHSISYIPYLRWREFTHLPRPCQACEGIKKEHTLFWQLENLKKKLQIGRWN